MSVVVVVVVVVVEFEWHGTCRVEFVLAIGTLDVPVGVLATSVGLLEWVSRHRFVAEVCPESLCIFHPQTPLACRLTRLRSLNSVE